LDEAILGGMMTTNVKPMREQQALNLGILDTMVRQVRAKAAPAYPQSPFSMRIEISPHLPDEVINEEWDEVIRYPAHPLIRWLAKFTNVVPYTEITVRRRRYKPAPFYVSNGIVICSPKQAQMISESLTQ
jgi:hypothetical protein